MNTRMDTMKHVFMPEGALALEQAQGCQPEIA